MSARHRAAALPLVLSAAFLAAAGCSSGDWVAEATAGRVQDGTDSFAGARVPVEPRRLVSLHGETFQSLEDITPDGTRVLFTALATGQLGLRTLSSGDIDWLTTTPEPWEPTWVLESVLSPDGRRVAYHQYDNATNTWSLLVRRLGQTGVDTMPDMGTYWNGPAAWSPDGRHLVSEASGGGSATLVRYDVATREPERIRSLVGGLGFFDIHYSPDGEWLAYSRPLETDAEERAMFLLRRDLGQEVRFQGLPTGARLVGWSPDGGQVLYEMERDGVPELYRQPVRGPRTAGIPELVQSDRWGMETIGMDDRGALYYHVHTGTQDVHTLRLDRNGDPSGAPRRRPSPLRIQQLNYSPDGKSFLYFQTPGGPASNRRLTVESLESGTLAGLDPGVRITYPSWVRWMPDGDELLLKVVDDRHRYAFYRYGIPTGAVDTLRVWNGPGSVGGIDVTPAGDAVVFAFATPEDGWTVEHLDLSTGQERTVTRYTGEGRIGQPIVSPRGDSVAFVSDEALWMAPLSGGQARRVNGSPLPGGWGTSIAWHPDGRRIYLHGPLSAPDEPEGRTSPERQELLALDVRTGEVRGLGVEMDDVGYLDVRPDGGELAFVGHTHGRSEIWVLEGVFDAEAVSADAGGRGGP